MKSCFTVHKSIQNTKKAFQLKLPPKLLQNTFHLRPIWYLQLNSFRNKSNLKENSSNDNFLQRNNLNMMTSSCVLVLRIKFLRKILGVTHHKMHQHYLSGTFFRIQLSLLLFKLCRHVMLHSRKNILQIGKNTRNIYPYLQFQPYFAIIDIFLVSN